MTLCICDITLKRLCYFDMFVDALSFITSAASAVRHASTVERRRSMERERTEVQTLSIIIHCGLISARV